MNNRDKMLLECDLLRGNINRMCVTESIEESDYMTIVALIRIKRIGNYRAKQLSGGFR